MRILLTLQYLGTHYAGWQAQAAAGAGGGERWGRVQWLYQRALSNRSVCTYFGLRKSRGLTAHVPKELEGLAPGMR